MWRSPSEVCSFDPPSALLVDHLVGWVVVYLKDLRGGGASAGYVSSGFFGGAIHIFLPLDILSNQAGLTIGRVALIWINRKVVVNLDTI